MKGDLEHIKIQKEKVVLKYYKSYSKGPGLDNIKPTIKIAKKSKKLVLTGTHLKTRKYVPEPGLPNDNEPIIMPKVIGSVPKTDEKVILPDEPLLAKKEVVEPKPAERVPSPEKPTKSPVKKEMKPAVEPDPALLA